jgi:hypothetical protein
MHTTLAPLVTPLVSPPISRRPSIALLISAILAITLSGCSVLAAPCRISAAVVKTVPVVGKAVAVPLDACADVID